MGEKQIKEEKKELTFLAKIIVAFLFVGSLFLNGVYGILYLIAYAGIGFVGYVIFEHFIGIGLAGAIITVAGALVIHIWLEDGFNKEKKE